MFSSTTTTVTESEFDGEEVRFVLDADFDEVIGSVGVAGLRQAVIAALTAAGIENAASFRYRFSRGSIVVTVIGPAESVGTVNQAVSSGTLAVMVNGQTLTAQPVGTASPNEDDDGLSTGTIVSIVIAVFVAVILVALVIVYVVRSGERGSYEINEGLQAGHIAEDGDVTTFDSEDRRVTYVGHHLLKDEEAPQLYLKDYSGRVGTEV
jgi:hypothetical protein